MRRPAAIGLTMFLVLIAAATAAAPREAYRLRAATPIPGRAPSWDYLTLDAANHRLFLGRRADGVSVFDLRTRRIVGRIEDAAGANGAVLAPGFDRGYTANADGTSTVFDLATLKTIGRLKLGADADAAFLDAATAQVVFTRGDSHELTFIAAGTGVITGRLKLDATELEGVASDGKGLLFAIERDRAKIARVDAARHTLLNEWPLSGCELPTGVAIDAASGRLFIGCKGEHPVLTVLDTATGRIVAQPEIGRGNDGVVYDRAARRVFTSNGVDGNLVIYDQLDADTYKLSQAVTTRPTARTMAFDPVTRTIYTLAAEGMVDPTRKVNRRAGAFYPNRFFDDTLSLLEYGPAELGGGTASDDD